MTALERQILDHEARFYRHGGAKEADIRAELGLSATRYQLLNALLDEPAAEVYAPVTVHRPRRLRDLRRAMRRSL